MGEGRQECQDWCTPLHRLANEQEKWELAQNHFRKVTKMSSCIEAILKSFFLAGSGDVKGCPRS